MPMPSGAEEIDPGFGPSPEPWEARWVEAVLRAFRAAFLLYVATTACASRIQSGPRPKRS